MGHEVRDVPKFFTKLSAISCRGKLIPKNPQKSHRLHRHIFEIHGVKYRKSITNVLGTSDERMKARHKNVIKI